jgi:GNAT superfamily N-acetyltransferase
MATRTVPTAHGTAFFFDPHPNIWDRNLVALDSVDASFADLCREADEVQHDLPHRMLVFDGDAGRHADDARAAGWTVERHIAMVAVHPPDHDDVRHPVREVGGAALADARRRGVAAESWARRDPAAVEAVLAVDARLREVVSERGFASFADGEVASVAYLYCDDDGEVGQVEDVLTVPSHRGHGHARAVVLTALGASRAAGHRMTFLWADEDDWPKALYVKLGFEVVGRRWRFRRLAAPPHARRRPPA